MTLLQIKLPGRQSSSTLIESIFYRKYRDLRRIKLSNFKSLEYFADAIQEDLEHAFYLLTTRKGLYGVEFKSFILIHPDGIIRCVDKICRNVINKKLKIRESDGRFNEEE